MPRTVTGPRLTALTNPRRRTFVRVFVENPDSIYTDVTTLHGFNFLDGGTLIENLDQPVPTGTINLRREHRDTAGVIYSLSPTVAGSLINRNAANAYARFLKAGRGIKVYAGWDVPGGADNYPADYLEVFRGKIDEVDWKGADGKVVLSTRGIGAWLLDKQIEEEREYSDDTGVAMETVMQQILDDNESTRLGPVVLYVPVSPGVNLLAFKQQRKSVLEALRDLAFQIGWDVRYLWLADHTYRLTLYEPDRAKSAADWTLGPSNYFDVTQLKEGDADVRNRIRGKATDSAGLALEVTLEDAASIGEYDVKFMEFLEDSTSNIDTAGELTAMVTAALADLKAPRADQEIENDWFPIALVGDLGKWLANGKHYDADETMAVVQVRHEFSSSSRRTFIQSRGTIAGGRAEWLRRGKSGAGLLDKLEPFDPSTIYLGNFREIQRTATEVVYGFTPSPTVDQIWVYPAIQAPSGVEPWPPTAADVAADPSSAIAPSLKLTGDSTEFSVTIPPHGLIDYVQLEPRDALLRAGDVQRARVFADDAIPLVQTVRQAAGPSGLYTAVAFDVVDVRGQGGTVKAWTNRNGVENADPDAAPDGTVTVVSTPAHIDAATVFTTPEGPGTLLSGVKVHPGKGKRAYFEFINAQGVSSGQVSVTLLTNSSLIDETGNLVDGAIKTALQFATGIVPVQVLAALPGSAVDGTVVLLTTDGQLYRRVSGAWTLAVPAVNITGTIVASQIADATITTAKFAAGIRMIRIVAVLPGAGDVQGDTVFLTTDNKLYRWTGSAWTAAVATVDLTGTINTAQIAADAITATQIAASAVTTAKIATAAIVAGLIAANAVTTTTIADDAITTPKILAGQITAVKIAAGTITANEIAALTIVAANIAAGTITGAKIAANTITAANITALTITAAEIAALTITGAKIAANTITASNIAADTITAGEIAAGAISTSELAANAVTAAKIAALTITAAEIAASTITGAKIAANTITASNITAGTITSTELAANSIIAGKIAAGAINATSIIVDGVITAAKISVSVLSGITADLGTIVAGRLNSVNGHSYINLNATGSSPFIHHETSGGTVTLEVLANGNSTFSGVVASSSFTTGAAAFSGSATFTASVYINGGAGSSTLQFQTFGTTQAELGFIVGILDPGVRLGMVNDDAFRIYHEIAGIHPLQVDAPGSAMTSLRIAAEMGAGVVDNIRVYFGAPDSGGTGFRTLIIPN